MKHIPYTTLNTELEEPYIFELCIIDSLTLLDFLRLLYHVHISWRCNAYIQMQSNINAFFANAITAWKVSKCGVFSGLYFSEFWLNTEIYGVNLRIKSEYRKIRTRKNSVFGHFSRSEWWRNEIIDWLNRIWIIFG